MTYVRTVENLISDIEGLMEAARKHLSCCVAAHGLVMGAWPMDGSYSFDPHADAEVKDFGFNAAEVAGNLHCMKVTLDELRKLATPAAPAVEPSHDEILAAMGGEATSTPKTVDEMTNEEILADCKRLTGEILAAVAEKPRRKRGRPRGRRGQLKAANAMMAATAATDAAAEE